MTPIAGGSGQRERARSSGSRLHNSRGRIGANMGMGPYLVGRPSHHTGGALYGNQTMGAKNGGNKRRPTAQRRPAKRKLKSKTGENDSKLNRNQQSNESSGALGSGGQWYDDQLASNLDDSWPKT